MDNSVYLLSRNKDLIKCFLNCDCMGDIFKLEGLSTTINNFECKSLNNHANMIIVIDNIGDNADHLHIVKQIRKLQSSRIIKLVFANEHINHHLMKELMQLTYCEILDTPLDFLSFLNWIQNEDKEKAVCENMEREVLTHLNHLGISARVLGFTYLKEAVLMKTKESKMKLIEICDKIAREHHTTSSRVERCMRTALINTNYTNLSAYIGLQVSKVSCKDFISYLANHIISDHKE